MRVKQVVQVELKKKECRTFEYRHTIKTGARTETIVVLDGRVVRPSSVRRSKTGAHGEDYYCMPPEEWARAWVIHLSQSNSGRRSIAFENVPEPVRELLEQAWLYENAFVEDIGITAARLYSMLQK